MDICKISRGTYANHEIKHIIWVARVELLIPLLTKTGLWFASFTQNPPVSETIPSGNGLGKAGTNLQVSGLFQSHL